MRIRGLIRRRLLINVLADPDEVAARLPEGLRPHATDSGTVLGCCVLQFGQVRPEPLPAITGLRFQAAAPRISVEWEDDNGLTQVGVYVPTRLTTSYAVVAAGGRLFAGVHHVAAIRQRANGDVIDWSVRSKSPDFDLHVVARARRDAQPVSLCDQIAGSRVNANVAYSPDRNGRLEGVRMVPDHREAREVEVERLDSAFVRRFASARPAPSYLIEDVGVRWSEAPALHLPRTAADGQHCGVSNSNSR